MIDSLKPCCATTRAYSYYSADVYSSWAPDHQDGESVSIFSRWLKKSGKRDQFTLFQLVDQAYDSLHRLFIELHYLSCDGVGRATKCEGDEKGKETT